MDECENFFSSFFEPKSSHETYQSEYHEEQWSINETPEKVEVETDEINSYPEKCLRNHIRFAKCNTYPDTCSEESDIENIEAETSHIGIVKYFCHIDSESIYPACEQDKEEPKLSIRRMDSGKDFCFPLE